MTHVALIRVSWPNRDLSPNARVHWSRKSRAGRAHKAEAHAYALVHGVRKCGSSDPRVSLTFHPPDKRKRDLDNLVASMKYALDGVSEAWGVDDSRWKLAVERGDPVKGGCVMIEVRG